MCFNLNSFIDRKTPTHSKVGRNTISITSSTKDEEIIMDKEEKTEEKYPRKIIYS